MRVCSGSDPANPLNWSKRRKWVISVVGIVFAGMVSVNVSTKQYVSSTKRLLTMVFPGR